MLISEFAKVSGLPIDTIRFYTKKGLLTPTRGAHGGAKAYAHFTDVDVTTARMIRLQQSLGYSLREIAALNAEYRKGERSVKRTHEVLSTQIARLEAKRDSLDAALSFLRGKLEWIDAGKPGDAPRLDDYRC